jgi:hypothetical protein
MTIRKKSIITGLAAGMMLLALVAFALPAYMQTFMTTYKINANSTLGKAQCAICHPAKNKTSTLNPYGVDLQKAMRAAKANALTKANLTSVENIDSDKDGCPNIAEIRAGTLPGDPNSHPVKK